MRFEIRRLHDEFKITTVYVTHDQSEAMVTSDRIVVMNKGRIEQIDAPHVLYAPPEAAASWRASSAAPTSSRARLQGSDVRFDGFTAACRRGWRARMAGGASLFIAAAGDRLSAQKPSGTVLATEAEIVGRSYLGEYWDYQVRPLGGAKPLRVSDRTERPFSRSAAASGWRSIPRPWYG